MPFISKDSIEKVWDIANLVEVIQDFVPLKKSGAQYKGLSPWTKEKTGSFMVSPAKGIWKDFSTGNGGNSAVSFLMQKMGITYPEAIEWLAKKYNVSLVYDENSESKAYHQKVEKQEGLRPLLESTIRKFEEAFAQLPADHPAKLEVFGKRQYSQEVVDDYRIGYAPGGKYIYDLCVAVGRKEDAMNLGLISDTGDKWHNRVIYPLVERKGTSLLVVGLAGRALEDSKKYAKWINSVDSELYNKSQFWYGLDKAREAIAKKGEVWLVEGYNDVIAWHTHGIPNAIAGCGTAIAVGQIRVLKKICTRVIFNFDPDGAGKSAMVKYIPEFIKEGFRVQMVVNQPRLDPDDFVRHHKMAQRRYDLSNLAANIRYRQDGFKFLMTENFKNRDEVAVAQATKELVKLVATVEDEGIRTIYKGWLTAESSVKAIQVNKWFKEVELAPEKKQATPITYDTDDFYRLPDSVKEPMDKLRPFIEKYQMFMANNQIFVQQGQDPPYTFRSFSNFEIEIIQHMQDEKFPMKLVRIRNVHKLERIFDMQSAEMNTPMAFENAVTAHGNFRWKGGRREHELLKTFLFDSMGTGRKIEVLGWQPEGFWVWNNKVTVPGENDVAIDDNGVFMHKNVMYYVPSANKIYSNNIYKFEAQKRVVCTDQVLSFQNFSAQLIKVHRQHGMMGILFSLASTFQDIVVSELNFFPMLFLFGPASSGKDQLADVCQSFFGIPQTAINLEGGVSTIKAQVREFAQFCNLISQLSEYKNGDPKLDGVLKGLWDRRGYKRGNIDSHVGTESIPILSSVVMTGNYAPDQEALISRFIWEFMDKTIFDDAETKEYEKLADMVKKGLSGYTDKFLHHRAMVRNNFKAKYREFKATLGQRRPEAQSRMLANLAVLGTFYQMFQNAEGVSFPFSFDEMLTHFDKTIDAQMNKMNSASIINRWWDCFLASMRGTLADQIREGRDLKLEGDRLYFNFTSCYNRVQRQWYSQYRDNAPAKGVMMDSLKKDKAFIDTVAGVRFAPGKESKATSAYVVQVQEIPIKEEIKFAVDFQRNEHSLFPPPATPEEKNNDTEELDLPF